MTLRISIFWVLLCLLPGSLAMAEPRLEETMGCVACHRFSPGTSIDQQKAPDLFYAGNKFQKKWLEGFLQNPTQIRKAGFVTALGFLSGKSDTAAHVSLSEQNSQKMSAYLISLKLQDLETKRVDDQPLSKGQRVRTKILFERDYGCIACHEGLNLTGQARGGVSGPSLANAGNRLQADWVFNRLKTPEKFALKSRMPKFPLEEDILIRLSKYILSLKLEPTE